MPCTTRPISDDGEYRLDMRGNGVELTRLAEQKLEFSLGGTQGGTFVLAPRDLGFDVFVGHAKGVPNYRVGVGSKGAPLPPATKACGPADQYLHSALDEAAVYTGYAGSQQTACLCRDSRCTSLPFGTGTSFLGAGADGTVLSYSTNSTMTESALRLHRGGRELVRAKLVGSCAHAAVATTGRIFVSCAPRPLEEEFLLELHPKTLAVLGRRPAPLGVVTQLDAGTNQLAVTGSLSEHGTVSLVPFDWVIDGNSKVQSTLHLGQRGAIVDHDGRLELLGEPEDVLPLVRCWNGERMFGVGACRSALAQAP